MIKVKVLSELKGYAKKGEMGKVSGEWSETRTKARMRSVKFKGGGYAVFGDTVFKNYLEEVK